MSFNIWDRSRLAGRGALGVLAIGISLVSYSACTTASEVQRVGADTFVVNSAACPACGGTAKSATLAMEKAQQFCANEGKMMVMQNVDSRNINAVGAGASTVQFSCAAPVGEQDVQACYDKFIADLKNNFGADTTRLVLSKFASTSDFKTVSDASYPTEAEVPVILGAGEGMDRCEKLGISVLPPAEEQVAKALHNKRLALIARLSSKSITYGQYAMGMNEAEDVAAGASAQHKLAERDEQRWQAEQRLRAAENLSNEINRLTQPPAH